MDSSHAEPDGCAKKVNQQLMVGRQKAYGGSKSLGVLHFHHPFLWDFPVINHPYLLLFEKDNLHEQRFAAELQTRKGLATRPGRCAVSS